jgi:hypothetical protein
MKSVPSGLIAELQGLDLLDLEALKQLRQKYVHPEPEASVLGWQQYNKNGTVRCPFCFLWDYFSCISWEIPNIQVLFIIYRVMQAMENLGFRDPKETLKDIILMQGYEYQQDQPLLDRVDNYTREVALEVLGVLEEYIRRGHPIHNDELNDFILSDGWAESTVEISRVLH